MGIAGVTICPDCDADLSPTGSDENRPVQSVTQACSNCSYETTIGLLWYGNTGYEIVADVSDVPDEKKNVCDKSGGTATTVVIPREVDAPRYYSKSNTRAHHQEALRCIHG